MLFLAFSWHVIAVTYSLYKKMEDESKRSNITGAVYQTSALPPQYQMNTVPPQYPTNVAPQHPDLRV